MNQGTRHLYINLIKPFIRTSLLWGGSKSSLLCADQDARLRVTWRRPTPPDHPMAWRVQRGGRHAAGHSQHLLKAHSRNMPWAVSSGSFPTKHWACPKATSGPTDQVKVSNPRKDQPRKLRKHLTIYHQKLISGFYFFMIKYHYVYRDILGF